MSGARGGRWGAVMRGAGLEDTPGGTLGAITVTEVTQVTQVTQAGAAGRTGQGLAWRRAA